MYDLIILGAGAAGLSAAIYGARNNLNTLIIEKEIVGGQITLTDAVDNYPGVDDTSGTELSNIMLKQAEKFGAKKVSDTIISVNLEGKVKVLKSLNNEYRTKALIIASGANPRKLEIPGEREFTGRGVGYCATCDGPFYSGLEVFVVGGGDAALEEAIFLTKFARKVTIIYRGDKLRAAKSIQDKAFANDKISFIYNTNVTEVYGDGAVNKMKLVNGKTGETYFIDADPQDKEFGLFIFVGYVPNTEIFNAKLNLENGYIVTDEDMMTNIEGVYAAGDVRKKKVRQVVTAASDGAIAAISAGKYIEDFKL